MIPLAKKPGFFAPCRTATLGGTSGTYQLTAELLYSNGLGVMEGLLGRARPGCAGSRFIVGALAPEERAEARTTNGSN